MLTLETLSTRLQQWSDKFRQRFPTPAKRSPIALYQETFALVHDLKSSVFVSEDSGVRALLGPVQTAEDALRKLASDELELAGADTAALDRAARALVSVEMLTVLLEGAIPRARTPERPALALLALPFPWEALARGRATSAARHGYVFREHTSEVELAGLTAHDESLAAALRDVNALVVVRLLTPKPLPSGSLALSIRQIAAFPTPESAPSPWREI